MTRLSTSLAEAPGYTTITSCMGMFISCISSMGMPKSDAKPNTTMARITSSVDTGRFNTNFVMLYFPPAQFCADAAEESALCGSFSCPGMVMLLPSIRLADQVVMTCWPSIRPLVMAISVSL